MASNRLLGRWTDRRIWNRSIFRLTNNGKTPHKILISALSNDGLSFSEKELRDIEQFLESRGFSGNLVERVPIIEKLRKAFG